MAVNLQDPNKFEVNIPPTTGKVFFVDSNHASAGDSAGKGSRDNPYATIDFAIGDKATANKGDVIVVAAGHAETISTATSLVIDVAGLHILGLGVGTTRPRLTFSTVAGATISITAANTKLENLWLYSDFTGGITIGITASAAADGLHLKDIVMEEAANTKEFLTAVSIAAACHDVVIEDFSFHGILGGSDVSCISFAGASSRSVVRNSYFFGDWSASVIDGLTAASVGKLYQNIVFYQDDAGAGLGIDEHDSSTGIFDSCRWMNKKDTVEGCTGNLMAYNQCYGSNALNVQGILEPVADS